MKKSNRFANQNQLTVHLETMRPLTTTVLRRVVGGLMEGGQISDKVSCSCVSTCGTGSGDC